MNKASSAEMHNLFSSPFTGNALEIAFSPLRLKNGAEEFLARDGVFVLLPQQNQEYEGAYLNKIKYNPQNDVFPFTIPLWMLSHGYVWEVRKQFIPGAVLCELGCASGVRYFGRRYNMIGVDFSLASLKAVDNYQYLLQANALALPFRDESLDGIISSFFWEHISPADKEMMLKEFYRVLKPRGKVVMLYDIETNNSLIGKLKQEDIEKYEELFLHGDYHIGYESLEANEDKFVNAGFKVNKHFGMERTIWISNSAYTKLSTRNALYGKFSKLMKQLTSTKLTSYIHMFAVRAVDETIGRMFKPGKSRIALSVLEKK